MKQTNPFKKVPKGDASKCTQPRDQGGRFKARQVTGDQVDAQLANEKKSELGGNRPSPTPGGGIGELATPTDMVTPISTTADECVEERLGRERFERPDRMTNYAYQVNKSIRLEKKSLRSGEAAGYQ